MWRRSLSSLPLLIRRSNSPVLNSPMRALSTSSDKAGKASDLGGGARKRSLNRRIVQIGLISIGGGFALSGVNDLAIYHGCTSKAIEKASENSTIIEAIGLPIVRGPWYNASLAVGQQRRSVSCTFPVSGPQGSAIFQFKAIRSGDKFKGFVLLSLFGWMTWLQWDKSFLNMN